MVHLGREEGRLAWHLRRHPDGLTVVPQARCGPYRIDLGIWPVGVEIHTRASQPKRSAELMTRAEHLIEAGWSLLYLWLPGGQTFRIGPWGAPAQIAAYRRQVLAGGARPFRLCNGLGTIVEHGGIAGGRLVFDEGHPDPNNPYRVNALKSLVWAGLTDDERAGVRAKTLQMRPGGGVEPYEKKPVVYGKRFLRWTVWE